MILRIHPGYQIFCLALAATLFGQSLTSCKARGSSTLADASEFKSLEKKPIDKNVAMKIQEFDQKGIKYRVQKDGLFQDDSQLDISYDIFLPQNAIAEVKKFFGFRFQNAVNETEEVSIVQLLHPMIQVSVGNIFLWENNSVYTNCWGTTYDLMRQFFFESKKFVINTFYLEPPFAYSTLMDRRYSDAVTDASRQYGDVLLVSGIPRGKQNAKRELIHTAVFIVGDFIFEKVGVHEDQPYRIGTWKDLNEKYLSGTYKNDYSAIQLDVRRLTNDKSNLPDPGNFFSQSEAERRLRRCKIELNSSQTYEIEQSCLKRL